MRWLEVFFGCTSALLGIAALAYFLFGPVYQTASSSSSGETIYGTASGLQVGLQPFAIAVFIVLAALCLGIALAAILDVRGSRSRRSALWVLTLALASLTLLSIASIGLMLLPSLVSAIVTSVLAQLRPRAVSVTSG